MMVYNTSRKNVYRASSPQKLDLTLSEWKTLLLDQSAEVSGRIHAPHLAKSLKSVRTGVKWKL